MMNENDALNAPLKFQKFIYTCLLPAGLLYSAFSMFNGLESLFTFSLYNTFNFLFFLTEFMLVLFTIVGLNSFMKFSWYTVQVAFWITPIYMVMKFGLPLELSVTTGATAGSVLLPVIVSFYYFKKRSLFGMGPEEQDIEELEPEASAAVKEDIVEAAVENAVAQEIAVVREISEPIRKAAGIENSMPAEILKEKPMDNVVVKDFATVVEIKKPVREAASVVSPTTIKEEPAKEEPVKQAKPTEEITIKFKKRHIAAIVICLVAVVLGYLAFENTKMRNELANLTKDTVKKAGTAILPQTNGQADTQQKVTEANDPAVAPAAVPQVKATADPNTDAIQLGDKQRLQLKTYWKEHVLQTTVTADPFIYTIKDNGIHLTKVGDPKEKIISKDTVKSGLFLFKNQLVYSTYITDKNNTQRGVTKSINLDTLKSTVLFDGIVSEFYEDGNGFYVCSYMSIDGNHTIRNYYSDMELQITKTVTDDFMDYVRYRFLLRLEK